MRKIERGLDTIDANIQKEASEHLVKHIYIEDASKNLLVIGMNSMMIDSREWPGIGYFTKDQLNTVEDIITYYKKRS